MCVHLLSYVLRHACTFQYSHIWRRNKLRYIYLRRCVGLSVCAVLNVTACYIISIQRIYWYNRWIVAVTLEIDLLLFMLLHTIRQGMRHSSVKASYCIIAICVCLIRLCYTYSTLFKSPQQKELLAFTRTGNESFG